MMKLISETKDDSRLRSLAYVAVGKIVRRAPQLVKKDIGLAQKLFDAIGQVILIIHCTSNEFVTFLCLKDSNEILWGKRLPIFCYLNKQEDAESRLAVQEALSLMSSAYTDIDQSARILMEALITQNIEKVRL